MFLGTLIYNKHLVRYNDLSSLVVYLYLSETYYLVMTINKLVFSKLGYTNCG